MMAITLLAMMPTHTTEMKAMITLHTMSRRIRNAKQRDMMMPQMANS